MKTQALCLLTAITLAGPALAQPMDVRALDRREFRIERAYRHDVRTGVLTDDQYRRCMNALRRIREEEANIRAQTGGRLPAPDYQRLNLQLDHLNQWAMGQALSDIP